MEGLDFSRMQSIQKELQEKYQHKHKWPALTPEQGRSSLLWMITEVGEVADIIKKEGDRAIMDSPQTREHFVEELCDVMMYFNDLMLCYSVTPEELEKVYLEKHHRNMGRW